MLTQYSRSPWVKKKLKRRFDRLVRGRELVEVYNHTSAELNRSRSLGSHSKKRRDFTNRRLFQTIDTFPMDTFHWVFQHLDILEVDPYRSLLVCLYWERLHRRQERKFAIFVLQQRLRKLWRFPFLLLGQMFQINRYQEVVSNPWLKEVLFFVWPFLHTQVYICRRLCTWWRYALEAEELISRFFWWHVFLRPFFNAKVVHPHKLWHPSNPLVCMDSQLVQLGIPCCE